MGISQLRNQVNALMRKFTVQLAVHKLRPLASEYCDQWRELVAKKEPPPNPNRLFDKIPGKNSLRHKFSSIQNYLDNCRWNRHLPHPNEILRRIYPNAVKLRIVPVPRRPNPTNPVRNPHGRQWAEMGGKSPKNPARAPAPSPPAPPNPNQGNGRKSAEISGKSGKIPPILSILYIHVKTRLPTRQSADIGGNRRKSGKNPAHPCQ